MTLRLPPSKGISLSALNILFTSNIRLNLIHDIMLCVVPEFIFETKLAEASRQPLGLITFAFLFPADAPASPSFQGSSNQELNVLFTPYNLLQLVRRIFSESETAHRQAFIVWPRSSKAMWCLNAAACPNLSIYMTFERHKREAIREGGDGLLASNQSVEKIIRGLCMERSKQHLLHLRFGYKNSIEYQSWGTGFTWQSLTRQDTTV